jgi:ABC-2 type transport system ATP-binding protein
MTAIELTGVSRWYGNVVAVNDVTLTVGPGVTGLLGPNGAGKTTVLHMIAGLLSPSQGTVQVGGASTWRNHELYRTLGLVTEHEGIPGFLTASEFVLASAKLHRLPDPVAAAERALGIVELGDAVSRRISTYSKGMRQRTRADDPVQLAHSRGGRAAFRHGAGDRRRPAGRLR